MLRRRKSAGRCAGRVQVISDRSSGGAEIDLLLAWPTAPCGSSRSKRSLSPKLEQGFHAAADLKPARSW